MPLEWLIDIIKEWVQAQAYATEAWVHEWITPVNVTGAITPDVTCTYFKAGTHSSKPYYRSQDGLWFIWWWYQGWWYISSKVGRETPYTWWKAGPEIEGDYTPLYGATGTATVAVGRKFLCTGSVNRGDPADWDWSLIDFTLDGTWRTLSLAEIIPENTKSVLFFLYIRNSLVNKDFLIRKKGFTNNITLGGLRTQVGNVSKRMDIEQSVDENREIEYYGTAGGWITISLVVKGWRF